MKHTQLKDKPHHAPGAGSDKQHPFTPSDANERFRKQNRNDLGSKNQNKKK